MKLTSVIALTLLVVGVIAYKQNDDASQKLEESSISTDSKEIDEIPNEANEPPKWGRNSERGWRRVGFRHRNRQNQDEEINSERKNYRRWNNNGNRSGNEEINESASGQDEIKSRRRHGCRRHGHINRNKQTDGFIQGQDGNENDEVYHKHHRHHEWHGLENGNDSDIQKENHDVNRHRHRPHHHHHHHHKTTTTTTTTVVPPEDSTNDDISNFDVRSGSGDTTNQNDTVE